MAEPKKIIYLRLPCKKVYPLGVLNLASYLHRKFPDVEQKVVDLALFRDDDIESFIQKEIDSYSPDIIAVSWRDIQIFSPIFCKSETDNALFEAFNLFYSKKPFEMLSSALNGLKSIIGYNGMIKRNVSIINRIIKRYGGKSKVAVGGPAFSVFSEFLTKKIKGDFFGIVGEGEKILEEIITGKISKSGIYSGKENQCDIKDVGINDISYIRKIFPGLEAYKSELVGVQTKRGCPHKCIFCVYKFIEGEKVRLRDPESVVMEIKSLVKELSINNIWFADSQFIPSLQAVAAVKKLLKSIIDENIKISWSGYVQPAMIDEELARLMVESGLDNLEISATSGSSKIMELMKLGFKKEDMLKGCENIKKAGYSGKVFVNYSLNAPGETKETLFETIEFQKRIYDIFGYENVSPVLFFIGVQPHTEMELMLIEKGVLKEGYDPVNLNPISIKKLLHNPKPLDKIISKACLKAANAAKNGDVGRKVFEILEEDLKNA